MSSTVKNTIFHKKHKSFLRSLSESSVKYLIVGGYAVGFHGHPRMTRDLDIWIGTDSDNAQAMLDALDHYGTPHLFKETFETPNNAVQMGKPPERIDILTSVNGVTFQEAHPRRETTFVDKLELSFIDLESLIKTKTATGRARDAADIEDLQRLK